MIKILKRPDLTGVSTDLVELIKRIEASMASGKPVRFLYDGLERLACPHVLAVGKDGAFVKCFQFGGESSQGPILRPEDGGWRNFKLRKFTGWWVELGGPWYPIDPPSADRLEKSDPGCEVLSHYVYPGA